MKQKKNNPVDVYKQVVLLYAGFNGYLDKLSNAQIANFEESLFVFLETSVFFKPYKYLIADVLDKEVLEFCLSLFLAQQNGE